MTLPEGLYDLLLTEGLVSRLNPDQCDVQELQSGSVDYLVELLVRQFGAILEDLPGSGAANVTQQLDLVLGLLTELRKRLKDGRSTEPLADIVDLPSTPLRVLKAVRRDRQFPTPPDVGLTAPWLFT